MAWLSFGLPLEEELEVEKQVRVIRACDDIEQLRQIAEQTFRLWVQQADITRQLIEQVGQAEDLLAQAGVLDEPNPYVDWAQQNYPGDRRSGHI